MQIVIEKAVLKITQQMEKNRKEYVEAEASYNDSGYDRYWKKMQRLDTEYGELEAFLHPKEEPVPSINHEEEYLDLLRKIKGKWYYLKFDIPVTAESNAIDELLMDVR